MTDGPSGFVDDGIVAVPPDVASACAREWERIGSVGEWWTGRERVHIGAQARRARDCQTCATRRSSLTVGSGTEGHGSDDALGVDVVDTVHRIVTDPGRFTQTRYNDALTNGRIDPAAYVEAVGVIFTTTLVDRLAIALGASLPPLPSAADGTPSRNVSAGAGPGGAWVPLVGPEHWTGELAQIAASIPAGAPVANIILALSLAPSEHLGLITLMRQTYRHPEPALREPQIQLLASTVSAANECFY